MAVHMTSENGNEYRSTTYWVSLYNNLRDCSTIGNVKKLDTTKVFQSFSSYIPIFKLKMHQRKLEIEMFLLPLW